MRREKSITAASVGVCLLCSLLLAPALPAHAEAPASPSIVVLGQELSSAAPPIMVKGRVLIPLRAVAEALGAEVQWNAKTGSVAVTKYYKTIDFVQDPKSHRIVPQYEGAYSEEAQFDVDPVYRNHLLYVPLRPIAAFFGYTAGWMNKTATVRLPITESMRNTLQKGSLAEARNTFASIPLQYLAKPLTDTSNAEPWDSLVAYPEGEATHCFYNEGNLVQYIELKDDFRFVVWQAHLKGTELDWTEAIRTGNLVDETGDRPSMNKRLVYASQHMFGDVQSESYGYIDTKSKYTTTGYRKDGPIKIESDGELKFPDE